MKYLRNFAVYLAILVAFLILTQVEPSHARRKSKKSKAEEFSWAPIREGDWQATDEEKTFGADAVMLLERITIDDTKLKKKRSYISLYQRFLILTADGKKWADVFIPLFDKDNKVEDVRGRVILRSGDTLNLDKKDIHEEKVFKTEGLEQKQVKFSLSGVEVGSIVEFYYRVRRPEYVHFWEVQKTIPLRKTILEWKYGPMYGSGFFRFRANPRYACANCPVDPEIKHIPVKDPDTYVYSFAEVPPQVKEPLGPLEFSTRMRIKMYYGSWKSEMSSLAATLSVAAEEFAKKNKRVKDAIKPYYMLETDEEKADSCYYWIKDNLRLISQHESLNMFTKRRRKLKKSVYADDIIKQGAANEVMISLLYYDMLRELDIPARLYVAADRTSETYIDDIRFFEIGGLAVAISKTDSAYTLYSPGEPFLEPGSSPWRYEGCEGIIVIGRSWLRYECPQSEPLDNVFERHLSVTLSEDSVFSGNVMIRLKGHPARDVRILVSEMDSLSRISTLTKDYLETFSVTDINDVTISGLDTSAGAVTIRAKVRLRGAQWISGGSVIVTPFAMFGQNPNELIATERKTPVYFDYPYRVNESFQLELPPGWSTVGVPNDTTVANKSGSFTVKYTNLGGVFSASQMFEIYESVYDTTMYSDLRSIFVAGEALGSGSVVMSGGAVSED